MLNNSHLKDESILNSKQKLKLGQNLLKDNEELKNLWVACYFERKLTKPVI